MEFKVSVSRRICIIFLFLFIFHSCSTLGSRTPQAEAKGFGIHDAKSEIEKFYEARNLKHIGYAIYSEKEGSIWGTLGKAPAHARFKVGSVTKVFTAIAILQLRDRGLLDLDEPVSRYLPEFEQTRFVGTKTDSAVTIRDLLFHNSGLQSDLHHEFFLNPKSTNEEILDKFHRLPNRLTEVSRDNRNQVWSYSNLSFTLLGIIIERQSGKSIEKYFQEEILKKAGMTHTTLLEKLPTQSEESNTLDGYLGLFFPSQTPIPVIRDLTAGSLSTTPQDMSRFIKALLGSADKDGLLITQSSYRDLIEGQNIPALNLEADFGLPVFRYKRSTPQGDVHYVGHAGSLPPFIANLLWDPRGGTALFIATNTISLRSGELAPFSHELFEKMTSASSEFNWSKPTLEQRVKSIQRAFPSLSNGDRGLTNFVGVYSSPMGILDLQAQSENEGILNWGGMDFHAKREGAYYKLRLRLLFGLLKIQTPGLETLSMSTFILDGKPRLALFADGMRMGEMGIAEKITASVENPKFKQRIGRYRTLKPDSETVVREISVEFDKRGFYKALITMKLNGMDYRQEFPLVEWGDNSFVTFGKGRGLGEILDFRSNMTLRYSGYELERED